MTKSQRMWFGIWRGQAGEYFRDKCWTNDPVPAMPASEIEEHFAFFSRLIPSGFDPPTGRSRRLKPSSANYCRFISQMTAPAPNRTPPVIKKMGNNSPKIKMIAPIFINISAWALLFSCCGTLFFLQELHPSAGFFISLPHSGQMVKVSHSMIVRGALDNYFWK